MGSKLDRRKNYTRIVLKESFMKRLQEKPLQKITITEVCETADINRSTFYTHYKDLYDLLYQIEDDVIEDLSQTLSAYNYTENEEAVEMTEKLLEYLAENHESCQILFSEHGDPTFQKKVMMLVHNLLLDSLINSKNAPYTEYLSLYIVNGVIHVVQSWLKNGVKESPKEMAQFITMLSSKGVSAFQSRG